MPANSSFIPDQKPASDPLINFNIDHWSSVLLLLALLVIVLVNQDFTHLGARFFGRDYARATFQWIVQNYKVEQQIGGPPFFDRYFGIQILKRKPLPLEQ